MVSFKFVFLTIHFQACILCRKKRKGFSLQMPEMQGKDSGHRCLVLLPGMFQR